MSNSSLDNFKQKESPEVCSSRMGSGAGEVLAPKGIAIDLCTDNIFIADEGNNRLQMFDKLGDYQFSFVKQSSHSRRCMPYGIKVFEGLVFVSEYCGGCVCVYTTEGDFVCSTANILHWPTGLDVERTPGGDICLYVCSSATSCVMVLSNSGNRVIQGSSGRQFIQPKDVKVYQDKLLVLDLRDPCLHVFSLEGEYQRSFISNGLAGDVGGPLFFCVDQSGFVIIGDSQSSRVKAISLDGKLLHEVGVHGEDSGRYVRSSSLVSHLIPFGMNSRGVTREGLVKYPRGLALDSKRRLVVIGLMDRGCLQIF